MANTTRFLALQLRLQELRSSLLPSSFSPTGTYTASELDCARGYRLLVHAEIEAFIEDTAKDALIKKLGEWKNGHIPSEIVLALTVSYHTGFAIDPNDPSAFPSASRRALKDDVTEVLNLAMTQYTRHLGDNHGIRIDNLKRLLLPVGIRFGELDQTWLTAMDEFGKKRGEVAHKSIGAQRAIDPLTEYNDVVMLLVGLSDLDERVAALAR